MGYDGESMWVEDKEEIPTWMFQFLTQDGTVDETPGFWQFVENEDNDNNWPFVIIDWNTEHVFLTRDEAETFAKAKEHRWDKWRVYCVPAEGELARVLNQG
jgi:hypothetical protein